MIGQITGKVTYYTAEYCVVNVMGVGYILFCTTSLLSGIAIEDEVSLFVHTAVKEDSITLFGFRTIQEKEMFLILQTVQGVGAKVAISILSCMNEHEIIHAVAGQDAAIFKSISGIGPKLALRIITELQGKFKGHSEQCMVGFAKLADNNRSNRNDAISALMNLGFDRKAVTYAIDAVDGELGESTSLDILITKCLQKLMPNGS